jgi:hypothetical protein
MRFKSYLIMLLMFMVAAAPVVDATICKDCVDTVPVRDLSLLSTDDAGQTLVSSQAPGSFDPSAGAALDLCPFCSGSVATMTGLACSAPSTLSDTHHLPKLLALSNLSKSITKPPQN